MFDGDISKWDVSRVKDMHGMFMFAKQFNSDISKWDVSRVMNMNNMFQDAGMFKQKLLGCPWVHSRASKEVMFQNSAGSIPRKVCTQQKTTRPYVTRRPHTPVYATRRPLPERELIARTPSAPTIATSTMACTKCGTFEKSGRVSCCAPGGAWHKNCGGAGNGKVGHTWSEGVEACKRKFVSSTSMTV